MIPYPRPKLSVFIPYPRVNCLKTIPFTAAHTYIAHIWQYPPPHPSRAFALVKRGQGTRSIFWIGVANLLFARAQRTQKARVYLDWFGGMLARNILKCRAPEITGNTFISTNAEKKLSNFHHHSVSFLYKILHLRKKRL